MKTRFSVTRKWKRLLAMGCSHGHLADEKATNAVLRFAAEYKPNTVIHLGDFLDLACLRAGATGGADESRSPVPDVAQGFAFLEALKPNVVLMGNHEDRLWRLRESPKAIVATLAEGFIKEIETICGKLKAKLVPYCYGAQHQLADVVFMHGWLYNENCIRDTAEAYAPRNGAVVFAHSHRAGMARGRRLDNPMGFNTGALIDIKAAEYAKHRRATLSWSQGFVWGEYTDTETVLWLHDAGQKGLWQLPL